MCRGKKYKKMFFFKFEKIQKNQNLFENYNIRCDLIPIFGQDFPARRDVLPGQKTRSIKF